MPRPYEWIDPWEEIARAEKMAATWYEREDYFHRDMRMAQQAAMDNTYQIRRAYELLLEKTAQQILPGPVMWVEK